MKFGSYKNVDFFTWTLYLNGVSTRIFKLNLLLFRMFTKMSILVGKKRVWKSFNYPFSFIEFDTSAQEALSY